MNTPESYKAATAELEEILRKMESDRCDIDSLAQLTARALELLNFCKERLFKADREVEKCLSEIKSTVSGQ